MPSVRWNPDDLSTGAGFGAILLWIPAIRVTTPIFPLLRPSGSVCP